MVDSSKRPYRSEARTAAAEATRRKVLEAGRSLFSRKGIDATTIAEIATRAGVSEATVYATVKSKSGLIEALMQDALFGPRFQAAQEQVQEEPDPVRRIALSACVARAIYEGESAGLSLLMKASAFSPELRKSQDAFEALRRKMQAERIDALFKARRARPGLTRETAGTLLWMFTGREIYHKLVHESRWSPQEYEAWLQRTLVDALTLEKP
ncbi:TetR/AcrR family transcriptional regulator [Ramlibacter sp. G-1-2-2]|uniref:TetR/AcrR family transcriptional regulator n=1 Tax=Ramlibacter agri TaxID=2728837 RepID=A0A848GXG6_9BURK|nr:TetR/AcrR family transcriptional regulator [Ramlibacter agri]NML43285.1 TetR/AcrR family transcriptional regulator [Ramlibacter agri]